MDHPEPPPGGVKTPQDFYGWLYEEQAADFADDLADGSVWAYFKLLGLNSGTILPEFVRKYREDKGEEYTWWTLSDFATFYNCDAERSAYQTFMKDCILKQPKDQTYPTFEEVIPVLQEVFLDKEQLPVFFGYRPANKDKWTLMHHIIYYMLTLLEYRYRIENGTDKIRDDYQRRVSAYAQSFGKGKSFYHRWTTQDKWIALWLLYWRLGYLWHNYAEEEENADKLAETGQPEKKRQKKEAVAATQSQTGQDQAPAVAQSQSGQDQTPATTENQASQNQTSQNQASQNQASQNQADKAAEEAAKKQGTTTDTPGQESSTAQTGDTSKAPANPAAPDDEKTQAPAPPAPPAPEGGKGQAIAPAPHVGGVTYQPKTSSPLAAGPLNATSSSSSGAPPSRTQPSASNVDPISWLDPHVRSPLFGNPNNPNVTQTSTQSGLGYQPLFPNGVFNDGNDASSAPAITPRSRLFSNGNPLFDLPSTRSGPTTTTTAPNARPSATQTSTPLDADNQDARLFGPAPSLPGAGVPSLFPNGLFNDDTDAPDTQTSSSPSNTADAPNPQPTGYEALFNTNRPPLNSGSPLFGTPTHTGSSLSNAADAASAQPSDPLANSMFNTSNPLNTTSNPPNTTGNPPFGPRIPRRRTGPGIPPLFLHNLDNTNTPSTQTSNPADTNNAQHDTGSTPSNTTDAPIAQTTESNTSNTQPDAQSAAQPADAQPADAQPSAAQTSAAQTSAAQTSAAQTSAAQTSSNPFGDTAQGDGSVKKKPSSSQDPLFGPYRQQVRPSPLAPQSTGVFPPNPSPQAPTIPAPPSQSQAPAPPSPEDGIPSSENPTAATAPAPATTSTPAAQSTSNRPTLPSTQSTQSTTSNRPTPPSIQSTQPTSNPAPSNASQPQSIHSTSWIPQSSDFTSSPTAPPRIPWIRMPSSNSSRPRPTQSTTSAIPRSDLVQPDDLVPLYNAAYRALVASGDPIPAVSDVVRRLAEDNPHTIPAHVRELMLHTHVLPGPQDARLLRDGLELPYLGPWVEDRIARPPVEIFERGRTSVLSVSPVPGGVPDSLRNRNRGSQQPPVFQQPAAIQEEEEDEEEYRRVRIPGFPGDGPTAASTPSRWADPQAHNANTSTSNDNGNGNGGNDTTTTAAAAENQTPNDPRSYSEIYGPENPPSSIPRNSWSSNWWLRSASWR